MPIPIKAGQIFNNARFFLNDTSGDVYNDSVLLPALKIAYEDLSLECQDNNIPFTNMTSAEIFLPAGTKNIGGNGGPALPTNLVEVIECYERLFDTNNDYSMMQRVIFLPKTEVQTTFNEVYSWQRQTINFIGATSDLGVKIDYIADDLNQIVDANSQIIIFNSLNCLSFRTAAIAANYIGENKTRSDELNAEALRCLEALTNITVKTQQSAPIRRRPFMSRYRQFGYVGGQYR